MSCILKKNSSVSFIFFGDYLDFHKEFDVEENDKFYNESEIEVIQHIINNRIDANFTIRDKTYITI